MEMKDSVTIPTDRSAVWKALNDPRFCNNASPL